jgi:hypothetical protein
MTKAKRNDIFLLEHTTAWTEAKTFKQTTSCYYVLAKATKVGRDGLVKEYTRAHTNYAEKIDPSRDRVMVISDRVLQSAARDLYDTLKDDYFGDIGRARSAILDRAEALR